MTLLEWRDEFSTGVADVDFEHRRLIELINEAHGDLDGEDAWARIPDMLGEIHARVSAHFALEERMMREAGHADYPGHKDDHERLLDEIRDIMDDFEESRAYDDRSFAATLQAWFEGHFKTWDARLHNHHQT